MSARLACWLNGHDWRVGKRVFEDLFGSEWKISACRQCGAKRRVLHRAWDAVA